MSLESQLSLSKNGGVYFEGTRVKPTDDPVLFVGLGGTGADALLRIKNQVQTRMFLPKGDDGRILRNSPNNISFLVVDTDRDILNKTCGISHFETSENEFVQITVDGLPMVIRDVVDKHLHEPQWNWYDPNLTANGGLDGANGIRQVGRFMLFWNYQSVRAKLDAAMRKVLKSTSSTSLKIFVLTGIGGGTGSGTFLDLAYLLRSVARDLTPNAQVQGYIFTPDLNKRNGGDKTSMYRNGFAALKELDYWMSTAEHEQAFEQAYPGHFKISSIDKPFDYCHIITSQNSDHKLIDYYDAMEAVGSNLFSYIVSEENLKADDPPALRTMYDNIAEYINVASATARYPANYRYLSVGSDKLEIPYTQITTLVAARVFEKLEPAFAQGPTQDSFNRDLTEMQLTNSQLWGFIQKDISTNPLLSKKKYNYSEIWPGNKPYLQIQNWMNGHVQPQLAHNRSNFTSVHEGYLRRHLDKLMKSEKEGPCYAARMIDSYTTYSMIKTMEAYKNDCASRAAASSGLLTGLRAAMDTAYAAGRNAGIMGRGKAAQDYMLALNAWAEKEYSFWVYTELAQALDDFIERLKKYNTRIFKKLLDSLTILPDIFRANLNQLRVDEEQALKDPNYSDSYIIRPLEFEMQASSTISQKVERAAGEFLSNLGVNLKRWVGINLDEIDGDILGNTDISGSIADFINNNFSDTLAMNMEILLKQKMPAGMDLDEYYLDVLKKLRDESVAMFHTAVQYDKQDIKSFSLISIPDDCPEIYITAKNRFNTSIDRPKSSSERSKLQWVKVDAGMPLFAFPEVEEMEKAYETAMMTSKETRRGVHLRWEWRELLPSPIPEGTWPDKTAPEKAFARNYNEQIRAAFDKCVAEGVIRENGTENALLLQANEENLDKFVLHGSAQDKQMQLNNLRRDLWGSSAKTIYLHPMGRTDDGSTMLDRVRENVLRFYDLSSIIKRQAEIIDQLNDLADSFTHVEKYVKALYADLIFVQGFHWKFRRAANDYMPIELFDKMTPTNVLDYEMYKVFKEKLNKEILDNVEDQFNTARQSLLGPDGNFIEANVKEKAMLLDEYEKGFQNTLDALQKQIAVTPIGQRGELTDAEEFYTRALEVVHQLKSMMGV